MVCTTFLTRSTVAKTKTLLKKLVAKSMLHMNKQQWS